MGSQKKRLVELVLLNPMNVLSKNRISFFTGLFLLYIFHWSLKEVSSWF